MKKLFILMIVILLGLSLTGCFNDVEEEPVEEYTYTENYKINDGTILEVNRLVCYRAVAEGISIPYSCLSLLIEKNGSIDIILVTEFYVDIQLSSDNTVKEYCDNWNNELSKCYGSHTFEIMIEEDRIK